MPLSTSKSTNPHSRVHLFPSFIIATIRALGSFIPFTLPLEVDGRVDVL